MTAVLIRVAESPTLVPPAGEIVVLVLTVLLVVALIAGAALLVRKAQTRRNR